VNDKRYACCKHCDEDRYGCPGGGHYVECDQRSTVAAGAFVCVQEPFAEVSPWTM